MIKIIDDNYKGTLNFLGSNSGFIGLNTSAYKIINGDTLVLIDSGYTVFNEIINRKLLKNIKNINIIITHMHLDHIGSLSQLILYSYFKLGINVNILSKCKELNKFLKITGCEKFYTTFNNLDIQFIKTKHVDDLDCYGFYIKLDNKEIIYTGDTNTLEPFKPYFNKNIYLYIDSSTTGSCCHFDIIKNIKYIRDLSEEMNIGLIHIDNREKLVDLIFSK